MSEWVGAAEVCSGRDLGPTVKRLLSPPTFLQSQVHTLLALTGLLALHAQVARTGDDQFLHQLGWASSG